MIELFNKCIEYMSTHSADIGRQLADHLLVSMEALLIAAFIGVLCGYLASLNRRSERWIMSAFNVLRVVPSLALLMLLIPVMGVGRRPAVTALTILAIPPILINTCTGFHNVPEQLVESARGVGLDDRQILYHVRIPQALPLILAGIRSALIEVIASATLAAKIGAGGLGEIIFTGLGLNRTDLLVIGGVLVGILSLASCMIYDLVRRMILPYKYANK